MKRVTLRDKKEFTGYLRACTDRQVQGVYDKESQAARRVYARLAEAEATKRGIALERGR